MALLWWEESCLVSVLELTDFTPERSLSPEKKALSVGRKVYSGFLWSLSSAAWTGCWVQCGQCQVLVLSTRQLASTGSLKNLVGKHQFKPERDLCVRQCNYSCWKALEGISSLQKNKKSKSQYIFVKEQLCQISLSYSLVPDGQCRVILYLRARVV